MRTLFLSLFFLSLCPLAAQDCPGDEHTFTVIIEPDAWPQEMSWTLSNGAGDVLLDVNVENGNDTLFTFCLTPADWEPCMLFTLSLIHI